MTDRKYVSPSYCLEVDGQPVEWVTTIAGGEAEGEAIRDRSGPGRKEVQAKAITVGGAPKQHDGDAYGDAAAVLAGGMLQPGFRRLWYCGAVLAVLVLITAGCNTSRSAGSNGRLADGRSAADTTPADSAKTTTRDLPLHHHLVVTYQDKETTYPLTIGQPVLVNIDGGGPDLSVDVAGAAEVTNPHLELHATKLIPSKSLPLKAEVIIITPTRAITFGWDGTEHGTPIGTTLVADYTGTGGTPEDPQFDLSVKAVFEGAGSSVQVEAANGTWKIPDWKIPQPTVHVSARLEPVPALTTLRYSDKGTKRDIRVTSSIPTTATARVRLPAERSSRIHATIDKLREVSLTLSSGDNQNYAFTTKFPVNRIDATLETGKYLDDVLALRATSVQGRSVLSETETKSGKGWTFVSDKPVGTVEVGVSKNGDVVWRDNTKADYFHSVRDEVENGATLESTAARISGLSKASFTIGEAIVADLEHAAGPAEVTVQEYRPGHWNHFQFEMTMSTLPAKAKFSFNPSKGALNWEADAPVPKVTLEASRPTAGTKTMFGRVRRVQVEITDLPKLLILLTKPDKPDQVDPDHPTCPLCEPTHTTEDHVYVLVSTNPVRKPMDAIGRIDVLATSGPSHELSAPGVQVVDTPDEWSVAGRLEGLRFLMIELNKAEAKTGWRGQRANCTPQEGPDAHRRPGGCDGDNTAVVLKQLPGQTFDVSIRKQKPRWPPELADDVTLKATDLGGELVAVIQTLYQSPGDPDEAKHWKYVAASSRPSGGKFDLNQFSGNTSSRTMLSMAPIPTSLKACLDLSSGPDECGPDETRRSEDAIAIRASEPVTINVQRCGSSNIKEPSRCGGDRVTADLKVTEFAYENEPGSSGHVVLHTGSDHPLAGDVRGVDGAGDESFYAKFAAGFWAKNRVISYSIPAGYVHSGGNGVWCPPGSDFWVWGAGLKFGLHDAVCGGM